MERKRVYTFGNGKAEGKADMRNLLGGKGANLAEMNLIGVPVPPGFTITTEVCSEYYDLGTVEIRCRKGNCQYRDVDEFKVWRCGQSIVGIRSFRCPCVYAGYDGHDPELRFER